MPYHLQNKGLIFILSSPSGGGKSSLARELLKLAPKLQPSISITTRPPRPGEINGKHYYFKTMAKFQQLIDQDLLLEHTKIYDHHYGTLKRPIEEALASSMDILFDIDWQGTYSITKAFPENTISVFILPLTIDILKQRLEQRNQDTTEVVELRLQAALTEIQYAKHYDYVIVNDHFKAALHQLHSIITTERIKRYRSEYLKIFGII